MSKVLFTADIHFGVPGRLDDILFACKVMREFCKVKGIDTVVVLGDLFHDRQTLAIDVLVTASKFFEETQTKYGQQWITFPGNHDMFLRHSWDVNSLIPMRKHMTVIEEHKILKLDDQRFWVLPFIQYEKAYMRVLEKIQEQFEQGDKLLTHVGVRGATLNTCFLLKDWSIVTFENTPFEKVYTGHFHSRQQIGENVWYPGSPIPFKFDEGDVPHGFYVYDTGTNMHKFVNIWKAAEALFPDVTPPPHFRTIPDSEIENIDDSEINNNIIRIAIHQEYSNNEKNELRDYLLNKGARAVRWLNLIEKRGRKGKEDHLPKIAHAEGRDLFDAWLSHDKRGHKGLDKKFLTTLNNEIITEGDELYVTEMEEF